ncbi:ThiF family adenylyltransferase [bacterium]|nr:ThiF family adenylyltransferase [bacterium]
MADPLSNIEQRYDRQRSLIPTEKLAATPVTILGVGAIGRQLTLQLAAMGVRQFQLIDFDHVDWPNVAAQGFATADIGQAKVHAVASSLFQFDPNLHVDVICDRWRPKHFVHDVVFSCVDSITARSAIWNGVGSSRSFWGDARMLGEVIRILTATDSASRDHYRSTLFEASQAQQGSCTARSTIYSASIAAGLLTHQFACWLRGTDLPNDIVLNLMDLS